MFCNLTSAHSAVWVQRSIWLFSVVPGLHVFPIFQEIQHFVNLETRPKSCAETSVRNCHSVLHNLREERRSRLHRGESLESRSVFCTLYIAILCNLQLATSWIIIKFSFSFHYILNISFQRHLKHVLHVNCLICANLFCIFNKYKNSVMKDIWERKSEFIW
jgi:hypothetical protein